MNKPATIISVFDQGNSPLAEGDAGSTLVLSVQNSCNQCSSCGSSTVKLEIPKSMLPENTPDSASLATAEVVVGIKTGHTAEVLWHTVLLPLMGFLSGAIIGVLLFDQELLVVMMSCAGIGVGILITRPLSRDVISFVTVLDNKHPEILF